MKIPDNNYQLSSKQPPWLLLIFMLVFSFLGLIAASSIGGMLVAFIFRLDFQQFLSAINNHAYSAELRLPLLVFQGITALGTFIAAPLFYLYIFEKRSVISFFSQRKVLFSTLLLTFFIVGVSMIVNSALVTWNQQFTFPEGLDWLEKKIIATEQQLQETTDFLTVFDSAGYFFISLLVIAVIPALGEELLFRGLIQTQLVRATKNVHLAIWITGFLFSAIHLQFYGILPRMFLGILFGYMYYWSGNLIVPVLAHFLNNAFTLCLFYLYQEDRINYDFESVENFPASWIYAAALLLVILLVFFRKGTVKPRVMTS